jgi:hypothetical protein
VEEGVGAGTPHIHRGEMASVAQSLEKLTEATAQAAAIRNEIAVMMTVRWL